MRSTLLNALLLLNAVPPKVLFSCASVVVADVPNVVVVDVPNAVVVDVPNAVVVDVPAPPPPIPSNRFISAFSSATVRISSKAKA
jgi:hypothetical protein